MSFLKNLFNRKPSRHEFAELAQSHLAKACPQASFVLNEDQFALRQSNGRLLYLANFYDEYLKASRSERPAVLQRVATIVQEPPMPATLEEVRASLLPVFRYRPGLECAMLDLASTSAPPSIALGGNGLAGRHLGRDLSIEIAVDLPASTLQVPHSQFSVWGITYEEALGIALDNLRHKASPQFVQVIPGTYLAQYGDFYDPERLLLPELAHQLTVSGNPVAMVPTKQYLIVSGDRDEAGKSLMVAMANKALDESPRHLTCEMFRLDGTQWHAWEPDGSCAQEHHKLMLTFGAGQYASQKAALDGALQREGRDVFVASFNAMQKSDGTVLSCTTLSLRVDTLMPEAEFVMLVDVEASVAGGEPVAFMVPWQVFRDEAGSDLEPIRYVLPRYRVCFNPDAQQMARMRMHAVSGN